MPKILITGDVHGHLDTMVSALETGYDFALQVGDLGVFLPTSNLSIIPEHHRSNLGKFAEYFKERKSLPLPVYFCKGNHEDFEFLGDHEVNNEILPNLFYVPNGNVKNINGIQVAFLGGNFSSKWFERPTPKHCQNLKVFGYLRKNEVDEIIKYPGKIDILITHEPSLALQFNNNRKYGCEVIQNLIEAIQPSYAFSGHIHKYAEGTISKTKCIALGAMNYNDRSTYELLL